MTLSRVTVKSPVGTWAVEGDADGITKIYLPYEHARATSGPAPKVVERTAKQLAEYFAGSRTTFDVPLHAAGTPFQQDVWSALTDIPYGQVRSYGDVAAAVGRPQAYRAVGNANGKNPWPVVVPCHRVVATDGLGGYGGGLDVKRYLLQLEGIAA
jgi:methylated-DNA-[protein]-cysteine S-methyltransferase